MKAAIYLVKFQSEDWDLPPYTYETIACFLDKTQAIAFSKFWWKKRHAEFPDDFYGATLSIEKQVETPEGIEFRRLLITSDGVTFKKCKKR